MEIDLVLRIVTWFYLVLPSFMEIFNVFLSEMNN